MPKEHSACRRFAGYLDKRTWYFGGGGKEGIPGIPPCPAIPTAGDVPASLITESRVRRPTSCPAPPPLCLRNPEPGGGTPALGYLPDQFCAPGSARSRQIANLAQNFGPCLAYSVVRMSHHTPRTAGDEIRGDDGDGKGGAAREMAPCATVCWGQEDRIFAITEKIDAQLERVCRRSEEAAARNVKETTGDGRK